MKNPVSHTCLISIFCIVFILLLIVPCNAGNETSVLILGSNNSSSQISVAPLNPAFVEYMEELEEKENTTSKTTGITTTSEFTGDISLNSLSYDTGNSVSLSGDLFSDEDFHSTGLIPSPIDFSYLSPVNMEDLLSDDYYSMKFSGIETTGSDLSSYDLRAEGGVTAVRDQGRVGSCWAFSSYGSLESYLLHNRSESWDFSENNMKNTLLDSYEHGFDSSSPNDGGQELMSLAYLARWDGPITESDDPYADLSTVSPSDAVVSKHLQETFMFPFVNNSTDIWKLMIMEYGAISVGMYDDMSKYFDEGNNTFYCNDEDMGVAHAVTLIGWDDNFDRNKFTPAAPGDGAYIVKNSWGDNWGEDGYFYVSYYDTTIGTTSYDSTGKTYSLNFIFTADNVSNYDRIYQYDPLGWCSTLGNNSSTGMGANIFTAVSNETLEAVSFYTVNSNSFYNISIYIDPENGPINTSGPLSIKNGSIPLAGYHTVDLDDNVSLSTGQNFSVVVEFTTPDYNYPIAVEMPISGYSSHADAQAGQSYVSFGSEWEDVSASGINICIKAFTTEEKEPQAAFVAGTKYVHVGEDVDFHDASLFSPDAWHWNFGDGTNSSAQNPSHNYSDTGVYTVSLNASNSYGNNTSVRTSFIHVLNSTIVVNSSGSADFTTIREAVDAASDGDIIVVEPGIYSENLYFQNDNISLVSSTGVPSDVTIASPDSSEFVVFVMADNITISNISAVGGDFGIYVSLSSGCNISNCYASGNIYGLYFSNSQDNIVSDCSVSENICGLVLRNSANSILNNNSMENNTYNTYFDSNPNIVGTSNLVDGKPIYYLVNSSDQVINASSNAGVVHLINCSNITVENLEIENNYYGFYLGDSSNVTISNSTSSGNLYGVYLSSSSDNTIYSCNINNMTSYGIRLTGSSSNLIYNNYFNNSNNVDVSGVGSNYWNITMAAGSNIINGSYLGGNYWAKPDGTGWSQTEYSVGNGFCAAYEITDDGNNTDYLPLTENAVQPDSDDRSSGNDNDGVRVKIPTVTSSPSNIAATDSSVRFVGKDAEVEYVFAGVDTPVIGISFKSETNEGYVMATVSLLNELPKSSPAPSSVTVYQGMEIVLGDETFSSGIGNAGISFSVSKQWLEANGFDETDIYMEHFSDGVWNRLSTTVTGEDDEFFYFEATTDGFSPFIICVDNGNELVGSEVQTENVLAESDSSSSDVDSNGHVGDDSNGNTVVFASLFIVLVAIIGVLYWLKVSGKNS